MSIFDWRISVLLRIVAGTMLTVLASLLATVPLLQGQSYWPASTVIGLAFLAVLFWDAVTPIPAKCRNEDDPIL